MKAAEYWKSDLLGRRQDAEFLYNFLIGEIAKRKSQGRTSSYVLNVDAEWGGGKTFFLDGLALDLIEKGHVVARINAWRDDHASDPYVAIMAAIDKALARFIKKPGKIQKAWNATKSSGGAIALRVGGAILKGLLKKHSGVSLNDLSDIVHETQSDAEADAEDSDPLETAIDVGAEEAGKELEKLFDASLEALIRGFNRTDEAMTDFRHKLEKAVTALSSKKSAPLFILIDELDRCRPTYAVQLLERVKHLFDVNGVVFVFATNSSQLRHSVAGAYGANFDGFRYLKRFFDRTYVFEAPSTTDYIAAMVERMPQSKIRAPEDALVEALDVGCKAFDFDLRAINHVLEMVDAAATAWRHKIRIDIAILFPVCAHFYLTQSTGWPSTEMDALKKWVLRRQIKETFVQRATDRSIDLGGAYRQAISRFRTMRQIRSASSGSSSSPTDDYVRGIFDPEWNGVSVTEDQPSIQTEILALVINAGRMNGARPPE